MKEINFCCLECGQGIEVIEPFPLTTECPQCKKEIPLKVTPVSPLSQCSICEGDKFYLQKDFNRNLGLFLVVTCGICSFALFIAGYSPLEFFIPLLIAPVLDSLLYFICPLITICYACEGIYREFESETELDGFDLATSSKLKIKRARNQTITG